MSTREMITTFLMFIVSFVVISEIHADDDFGSEDNRKIRELQEVIVRPKKEKYSKKNNPAVDFVNHLRGVSKKYDPANMDYYSYDKYEKTLFALNDFQGAQSEKFLNGKLGFFRNYVDTSSWTGKRLLDIMLKEKVSSRIRGREPSIDKEITKGYRSAGIDEILNQENVRIVLEDAIREIDIYGNDITVLQNRFVSPLSVIGPDFYKYYLKDTVYIGDERCIELGFVPHNLESMGFVGNLYIPLGDTTMFVKKITMRAPSDINLNYLKNLLINQSFEKDSIGMRHKTYDDVCIELQIAPGTPEIYARKSTTYNNFSYLPRTDLQNFYTLRGRYFSMEDATNRNEDFWINERMQPLTYAENRMGILMTEMRQDKLLYWGEKFLGLLESGYFTTGNPSKFDIGPVSTIISHNTVEGWKPRFGGMTTAALNSRIFAKGYVAYGTKDRKWKYSAELEYSFTEKNRFSSEWPRNAIYASYSYDLDMLGQHYLFTSQDNIFLSLKRKESILVTYRKQAKLGYILELRNNFSVDVSFKAESQQATKWVPFIFGDGRRLASFRQAAMNMTLRWAPGETFIQGRGQRSPVNMDAWIFQFTHEYGPKGFFGTAFELNRSELSIQKRLWLSAFGYANVILKGGIIWSSVYYPALMWPNANLSYTIQPESYSLMNAMEFANDHYASIDVSYFGNGVLFNRLPLIRKLKLREVLTFKGLEGGLFNRNNPHVNKNLLDFPEDSQCRKMSGKPYMELGVGIDNILTVLRVDYIWRLTYRNLPGCDNSGLRVSVHFSF